MMNYQCVVYITHGNMKFDRYVDDEYLSILY